MSAPRLAGGSHEGQRQRIGDEDDQRAGGLGLVDRCADGRHRRRTYRARHDAARRCCRRRSSPSTSMPSGSARVSTTSRICGCSCAGKHDAGALFAMMAPGDADGFGDRRRLVEQRGRRHRQAGQFGHQRLEIEQHLQPALADLGLVGRIGRVPGRVLEQIALDDRRHDAAVIAGADEALQHLVGRHLRGKLGERLGFARRRRQVERAVEPDRLRHGLGDQRLDRGDAERGQHGALVGQVRADMAVGEVDEGCVMSVHLNRSADHGPCSRPRRAGRKAGSRRRASSSRASRRRSAPN